MRRRGKGEGEGTGGRRRETPAIPPGQRRSAAAPQGINKQGHSEDNPGQRQGHSRDKCEDKTRTPGHGRATPAQQARRSSDKTRQDTPAPPGPPRTGHGQASDAPAQPPDARGQRRSAALLTLSAAADAPPRPDRPAGARGATTPRPPRGPAVARHCDSRRACAPF